MKNYYQVILKDGKTHKSLYKTPAMAVKKVGIRNIERIVEVRGELVETKLEKATRLLE